MNVAIHAQNLGSKVPSFPLLATMTAEDAARHSTRARCQYRLHHKKSEHPTGTVIGAIPLILEVYTIDEPSAWDYISTPEISWERRSTLARVFSN